MTRLAMKGMFRRSLFAVLLAWAGSAAAVTPIWPAQPSAAARLLQQPATVAACPVSWAKPFTGRLLLQSKYAQARCEQVHADAAKCADASDPNPDSNVSAAAGCGICTL
ncbi:hypothetical protein [Xanthomonas nasturtii]|uniref:hypothetical protein n=1 Tax=Xanthomonas nasturtii TaxID=1843581 RepID=UPI0020137682|nr:hypothetical protein [Xanthomonas nasturtii]MCL1501367.1 hypothetical protein [Xanthomonas nasturtii]MCL1505243.1 hypothetical protein [Xanthomonas nasturtii]MCL1524764.1 hypothetical protein [Xanthomonas nasturtii]